MKKENDINSLAEKWLNGTITEEEKQQFEAWYNNQPGFDIQWLKNETEEGLKKRIFQSIIHQLEGESPVIRRISWKRRLSAAAAVLLILGGTAFYLFNRQDNIPGQDISAGASQAITSPASATATLTLANGAIIRLDSIKVGLLARQGNATIHKLPDGGIRYENGGRGEAAMPNTLTVPRGGAILTVILADGSKVWLNAESSLRYPAAFAGSRQVSVSGEAYFEVSPSAAKPFQVNAEGVTTQVLGTHFNVNTFEKQRGVFVTLLEGAVKVSNTSAEHLLKPGQQAGAAATGSIRLNQTPDLEAVMAWKSGMIKLNNSDIHTVMQQLERWYDVDIKIENGVEGRPFSGSISRNNDLATVLEMLAMTKEISFRQEGRTIIVSPYR
ncbi:FecR domain-containing protein [Chitinophaga sp. YIM B06452]|uniref:FecR family protein n=1 Tax=Chitinophaga sp. YIM B06452 TaxID=3082158 RepID=UPI0031FEE737